MLPGLGGADVAGRDLDQDLDLRGTRWKVLFRGSSCGWAGPPWGIPLMLPLPCPLPGCRDHVPFLYKCTHLGASPTCPRFLVSVTRSATGLRTASGVWPVEFDQTAWAGWGGWGMASPQPWLPALRGPGKD